MSVFTHIIFSISCVICLGFRKTKPIYEWAVLRRQGLYNLDPVLLLGTSWNPHTMDAHQMHAGRNWAKDTHLHMPYGNIYKTHYRITESQHLACFQNSVCQSAANIFFSSSIQTLHRSYQANQCVAQISTGFYWYTCFKFIELIIASSLLNLRHQYVFRSFAMPWMWFCLPIMNYILITFPFRIHNCQHCLGRWLLAISQDIPQSLTTKIRLIIIYPKFNSNPPWID